MSGLIEKMAEAYMAVFVEGAVIVPGEDFFKKDAALRRQALRAALLVLTKPENISDSAADAAREAMDMTISRTQARFVIAAAIQAAIGK